MKLCFPEKVLDQHAAVLGKTGAGKSSAVRHVVEHLLDENKRVCVIDPKGDWWGLKLSADGKGAGYPVITFGDFKGDYEADVPINKASGKHIAELVTSGNRPCIIGFRGWFTADMLHFWIDFAKTLFHSNEGELYLVIDEAQNFAPKGSTRMIEGQGGLALHWTNRLLAEGRGLGINIWVCSQRPQKVHNDTLDGCETLVAMRVVHPAARGAITDWIEGAEDKDKGKEVLDSIGGMKRGEAIIWSPEIEFGPKRVLFPMFATFDSFAPPQLQKKVSKRTWDDVDLDEVKAKLASVIKEAEAKDPKALLARIQALESDLRKAQSAAPAEPPETVEIFVVRDDQIAAMGEQLRCVESALADLDTSSGHLEETAKQIRSAVAESRGQPAKPVFKNVRSPAAVPSQMVVGGPPNVTPAPGNGESPSGGMKRMMIALAQRPGLSAKQMGVRAGLSSSSGTFGTYLGKLRSAGWMTGDRNAMELTAEGIAALGSYEPLPEGEALYLHWSNELGNGGAGRMLDVLYQAYPNALTKAELGERANISSTSGTFGTYLSKLRTLELISGGGELKASAEFFE